MERRDFLQKSILTTAAVAGVGASSASARSSQNKNQVYDLRVYRMRRGARALENYFSKALIPALNRMGVKNVGVFSEMSKNEPATIYMLIPYKSFDDFGKITLDLKKDKEFEQARSEYDEIPSEQAVFERYDSSILLAFDGIPEMVVPAQSPRIFEMRTYEGYSEDAVKRKVKMFNEGELDIFKRTKINPVFFGEKISGTDLPCLTYMATYSNMEAREQAWKEFLAHPDWQKMSKLPEYANTVSKIHRVFLEPLPYSQV